MLSLVLSIVFYLGGGKITSGFCVSPGFSSRSNQVKHQVEKSLCWTSFTGTLFKGWLLSKQRGLWKDDFGDVYVLSKSSLGWWRFDRGHLHGHPREVRWSLLCNTGLQSWYQVAPLLAGPAEGQGQGNRWAPSLCPGEETLAHHCKQACCPGHAAPRWTVPGALSSGVHYSPCSQTRAHTVLRRINAFCLLFVWLCFRESLIPQVPLKKLIVLITILAEIIIMIVVILLL